MNAAIFTPLTRYKTPGKADVVFGTTERLDEFKKTDKFTEPVIYVTIKSVRCPHVACTYCVFQSKYRNCDKFDNLKMFPEFVLDFPELCI